VDRWWRVKGQALNGWMDSSELWSIYSSRRVLIDFTARLLTFTC
jgi:SH3-like domain-containing protein